jgi:hypothetical protein
MSQEKYIGLDVHQATISAAVMDAGSNLLMECLLETKAATILEFIQGLRGTLSLTFEEGTSAAWLHDLVKPHVSRLVVCDPRKAALFLPLARFGQLCWWHCCRHPTVSAPSASFGPTVVSPSRPTIAASTAMCAGKRYVTASVSPCAV